MNEKNDSFERVLVVVAHPDDEILSCGGTLAMLHSRGSSIRVIILGEGKTSRDIARQRDKREHEINELRNEVLIANSVLGVSDVQLFDFPDNRFDSVPMLDIIKVIENHVASFNPTCMITHFGGDMNVDHKVLNTAVLTATRPVPSSCVKLVMEGEILSSTGWHYPNSFAPNMYIGITNKQLEAKIDGMRSYASELREYPHPRSLESIRNLAQHRGAETGREFAEAFRLLRWTM